jgi:hypothetical protein
MHLTAVRKRISPIVRVGPATDIRASVSERKRGLFGQATAVAGATGATVNCELCSIEPADGAR